MIQRMFVTLDTKKTNYKNVGKINHGDDLILELTVLSDGDMISFNDPMVDLLVKKSDGKMIRQNSGIEHIQPNVFIIEVSKDCVTSPGLTTNQLIINDNGRISTCMFYYTILNSLEEDVIQSISSVEVLEQLDEYVIEASERMELLNNDINKLEELFGDTSDNLIEAEMARNEAEQIRLQSETLRVNNEKDRIEADNIRKQNEIDRLSSELVREQRESERILNEEERRQNESERMIDESTRQQNENTRQSNESIRMSNETDRKTQENRRVTAETNRVNAETTRRNNENSRISNEIERQKDMNEMKSLLEDAREFDEKIRVIEDGIVEINSSLDNIENEIDVNSVKVHFPQRELNKSDCIVIETKQNVTIIDVGWEIDSTNLVNYLKSKGINKINNIIITHYHDDHIGGVIGQGFNSFINSSLDFSNCVCYLPHKDIDYTKFIDDVGNGIADRIEMAHNSILNYLNNKGITAKYADEGEILKLNDLTSLKLMNISSTYLDEYYNQTLNNNDEEQGYTCYNNFSMVCELKHINNKFLFSGDIELKAQELLLNNLSGNYDVYKVEHHGVNKSTYKDYLYKINPQIAIVQNRSSLGLKNKMTTTYLYNKGCKIYDNTNCGDIIVKSNGVDVYVDSTTESKIDIGFSYCGQPYDLKRGIAIKENDDLNKLTDFGVYYSETSTITSSLQNKPNNISNSGFKLIVQARQTDTSPIQTIIDSSANIFIRSHSSGSFNEWKKISTKLDGFIECRLSSSHTTTSTSVEKLNIDTIICSRGDNLTLVDGCVVVGSGVNTIRVSGQIGWSSDASGSHVLEGYIYKNNSSIIRNGITSISTYFGVPLISKIIDVQEGDKISLGARSRTKEGFTVSNTADNTWICVEVV